MKSPAERPAVMVFGIIALIVIAVICVSTMFWAFRHPGPKINGHLEARVQPTAATTNLPAQTSMANLTSPSTAKPAVQANSPDFQGRPFPVAYESAKFQWTLADGKDTNVIRQLAHNPLEYARMVTENSEIFRRQLVYLKETAGAVFQQAKLTGVAVTQLTLPGLDGQEYTMDVTRTDLKDGGNQGQVYGQLPGQPDSMVTVAFVGDREAFTVISHQDQINLLAESHDPGQIVVKSINPNIYGAVTK